VISNIPYLRRPGRERNAEGTLPVRLRSSTHSVNEMEARLSSCVPPPRSIADEGLALALRTFRCAEPRTSVCWDQEALESLAKASRMVDGGHSELAADRTLALPALP